MLFCGLKKNSYMLYGIESKSGIDIPQPCGGLQLLYSYNRQLTVHCAVVSLLLSWFAGVPYG